VENGCSLLVFGGHHFAMAKTRYSEGGASFASYSL